MLEQYFCAPYALLRLRTGLSGPYMDAFADSLETSGYSVKCAMEYLRVATHLGDFLQRGRATIPSVGPSTLEAFLRHLPRCRCPRFYPRKVDHNTRCGVKRFHEHLVQTKVCQPAPAVEVRAQPNLVVSFLDWYDKHRGASESTLVQYRHGASALMEALGPDPTQWDARQIRTFVLGCAKQSGTSTAQKAVTATRAFLRYLIFRGECRADLDQAVPAITHWRLAALPPCLNAEELNRLITACDGDSLSRRRDCAIVLLLARLGLRAGDVARLRLTDIEWQTGTMRVMGKDRYEVRLPLPQEVGDAILRYLERRPHVDHTDRVFLPNIAPLQPRVSSSGISAVVKRALKRAGIVAPAKGAHLLRHTAATEMLRHGVPLEQIGLVLRHRSLDMTASYAKVDVALLQQVSQPWPEVKS